MIIHGEQSLAWNVIVTIIDADSGISQQAYRGDETMQENDFHEVADEFIHLANELSEEWAMPFLSAAFMYAAARYNTFFFYSTDGARENQSSAIDYYCDQYRKMLLECMHELGAEQADG